MDLAEMSGIELFSMPLTRTEANQVLSQEHGWVQVVQQLAERHDPRVGAMRDILDRSEDFRKRLPNDLLEALGYDIWYFYGIPFTVAEHRRWMMGRERFSDTISRIVLARRPFDPRRRFVRRAANEFWTVRSALSEPAQIDLFGTTWFQ